MKGCKNKEQITKKASEPTAIHRIDPNIIRANTAQPRQNFDTTSIRELAESIKQYGMLQPLTVRAIPSRDGYQYELIAGERRLRAARMLGLKTVPCLLAEASNALSAELALVENMLRENLDMFEQAAAFVGLSEKFGMTQEEIAQKWH